MRLSRSCVVHTTAIGLLSLAIFSAGSMAQKAAVPGSSPAQMPGLQCNGSQIFDPFKGSLAGPNLRPGLLPIDATVKDEILKSGLPCQENVRTGAQGDPAGIEATGLENLQRGFDFYSWRTFIALNSPADGKLPSTRPKRTRRRDGRTWTISSSCSTSCCRPTSSRRFGREIGPGWTRSVRG